MIESENMVMKMSDIKFVKEPGYVFDLLHIFIFHFNKSYMSKCMEHNDKNEISDFENKLEYKFAHIPDELFLFFYIKDDGKCFLPQYCFYDNVEKYQVDYRFENTLDDLLDIDRFVSRMIQFYFPEINDKEIEEYQKDIRKLIKAIDKSQYSDYIKAKLCVFFADYESIIKKLHFELISKEAEFKHYYEENYIQISEFQNNLNFTEMIQKMTEWKEKTFTIDQEKDIYISPCIIVKGAFNICFSETCTILVLGVESEALVDFCLDHALLPELDIFGTAVSEKNRVGIIDALLERDEMPIRDVERLFGMSTTNAYYHVNILTKAGVINIRNQGRTILYSLNRKYFDNLIEVLKKYGTQ